MGSAASHPMARATSAEKARSDEIDRELALAAADMKNRARGHAAARKVLVLGARGAGKTTVVKHMRCVYRCCEEDGREQAIDAKNSTGDGMPQAERLRYLPAIRTELRAAAHGVASYMRDENLECVEDANQGVVDDILASTASAAFLPPALVEAIASLRRDAVWDIVAAEPHAHEAGIEDGVAYLFEHAERIGAEGYVPTEEDILRSHDRSSGVRENIFEVMGHNVQVFDINVQRGVARKWIHCFEHADTVLFCAALSEYDEYAYEDATQTRLEETLALFKSVVSSPWFTSSSITLLLNKQDVFAKKLSSVPLSTFFPEFKGAADTHSAETYVRGLFTDVAKKAGRTVNIFVTQATDVQPFRGVLKEIADGILQGPAPLGAMA